MRTVFCGGYDKVQEKPSIASMLRSRHSMMSLLVCNANLGGLGVTENKAIPSEPSRVVLRQLLATQAGRRFGFDPSRKPEPGQETMDGPNTSEHAIPLLGCDSGMEKRHEVNQRLDLGDKKSTNTNRLLLSNRY